MTVKYLLNYRIILEFSDDEKNKAVQSVLTYLEYDKYLFYYLLFGYKEYNNDMQEYEKLYSDLKNDNGFIQLNKHDVHNINFIIDILSEYQIASLYINKKVNLTQEYTFNDLRESNILFEGYVINELKYNGIDIKKGVNMPDWDLQKMGISPDIIY